MVPLLNNGPGPAPSDLPEVLSPPPSSGTGTAAGTDWCTFWLGTIFRVGDWRVRSVAARSAVAAPGGVGRLRVWPAPVGARAAVAGPDMGIDVGTAVAALSVLPPLLVAGGGAL